MDKARLYVVATPIGNMDDISLRALHVLASVDVIAAEDTRHSRPLLTRHGIDRPLIALHEHNEDRQASVLVERLRSGESLALISDAGTPMISDPGYRLVSAAAEAGIEIVAVPGPSAVTAALSVSGLPTDRFVFEGFLPSRPAARNRRLEALREETRTLVMFESSHRIDSALADLVSVFGPQRRAAVCRELTKRFETVLRGTLEDIAKRVSADADQRKGEFVLVIEGFAGSANASFQGAVELGKALREHVGASQAARIASRIHGVSRRELYRELDGG